MVPWNRFENLIALEKKDFSTCGAVDVCSTARHSEGDVTVKATIEGEQREQLVGDSIDLATVSETKTVDNRPQHLPEGDAAVQESQQQGRGDVTIVEKVKQKDIPLLRPPGEPARQWLTWN
jgi:hypothetical protein